MHAAKLLERVRAPFRRKERRAVCTTWGFIHRKLARPAVCSSGSFTACIFVHSKVGFRAKHAARFAQQRLPHEKKPALVRLSLHYPCSITNLVHFFKISQKVVDSIGQYRHNNFCCFDVRRYLSWIEGLTTNQYVGGSNPSRRTISASYSATTGSSACGFFIGQGKERT